MLPGRQKVIRGIFIVLFAIVVSSLILICGIVGHRRRVNAVILTATAEAETLLTEAHGAEARTAIERLETQWYSLAAHRDPAVQAEVATGPYLEYWGYGQKEPPIPNEPPWSVIVSADVRKVRVVEYSPGRFKAVASVSRQFVKMTPEGDVIGSPEPGGTCGVYVFVREADTWKLAAFFLTTGTPNDVALDWDHAPQWLKDIIGELPSDPLCYW